MKGVAVISCLAMAVQSCGPPAYQGGFDSDNPSAKMYAMEDAARTGDRAALRSIIEQLDNDDPAVRSLAITVLKRLTGETYGYRDHDPQPIRSEAMARWVQAEKSGALHVRDQPAPTNPSTSCESDQSDTPVSMENPSSHG